MAESLEDIQKSENIVPDVTNLHKCLIQICPLSCSYEIQCYLKEFLETAQKQKLTWNLSHHMPYHCFIF